MVTLVLDTSLVGTVENVHNESLIQKTFVLNRTIIDLLSGTVAGISGKIIEHPFDTIKVNLQCQEVSRTSRAVGTLDCIKNLMVQDGARGLFRGISAPMFGSVMENIVLFTTYERVRRLLGGKKETEKGMEGLGAVIGAGGIAGMTVSLVLTPVELIKCRVQTDRARAFKGSLHCIVSTLRSFGLKGLYRGHGATLARESVGGMAWFGVYEYVCRSLAADESRDSLGVGSLMFAGALSGIAYNTVLFPADVVKSQIQVDSTGDRSYIRRLRKLYAHEGIKGLYRGYGITFIRAIPANAVILGSYELSQRLLSPQ